MPRWLPRPLAPSLCTTALVHHLAPAGPDRGSWIVVSLAAAAAVLFVLAPAAGFVLSDGELLTRQAAASPAPYYNLAFLPLGHAAVRAGAWIGLAPEAALVALSRGCALLGAAGLLVLFRRLGIGRGASAAAAAAALLAPGLVLFGSLVEVHALAFAGVAWALVLAEAAARRSGPAALVLGAASLGLALVTHLSHVLLAPALLAIATAGRWRAALAVVAGALLAVGLGAQGVVLAGGSGPQPHGPVVAAPLAMLERFVAYYVADLGGRGLFGATETGRYLAAEWLVPAGCVVAAALVAFPAVRERSPQAARGPLRALAATGLFALLLFSQGGVWEHGGYALSHLPAAALALALVLHAMPRRLLPPVAAGLLVAQATLAGLHLPAVAARHPDPRAWAARAAPRLRDGDHVLVRNLESSHAVRLRHRGVTTCDLNHLFDRRPASAWPARMRKPIAAQLRPLDAGARVLLQPGLLEDTERCDGRLAFLRAELERLGVQQYSAPGSSELLELRRVRPACDALAGPP